MTSPEEVTPTTEVTFCGYQIKKTEDGYALYQGKYIEELVKKYEIKKADPIPHVKRSATNQMRWIRPRARFVKHR